ncbi:MAG: hypothetical protein KJ714_00305 [Euryarchaeota archaeon]|nr:hypothetical protein [Euryarchaeota archaeon]
MEAGILVTALIVVIATFLLFRIISLPIYTDPFGKKSVRLKHNKKIHTSKSWRLRMIDDAERKGEKVILSKVGEFGHGMVDTVECALKKGFSIKIVSSNEPVCESRNRIIDLMEKFPEKFKYYVLDSYPLDHFAIIGSNIFIEVPHKWGSEDKESIGIENAHYYILNRFYEKFENTIKTAKKADIDFVRAMPCYLSSGQKYAE